MSPERFEPTIPASARPQIYALDRAATAIAVIWIYEYLSSRGDTALNDREICEVPLPFFTGSEFVDN
jgi:hypothetical protein